MSLFGKDLVCTQTWNIEDIHKILQTAVEMKLSHYDRKWHNLFQNKNFLMMFYSPSIWLSSNAYTTEHLNKQEEIEKSLSYADWIATAEKMSKTENAIFTHPMPIDRDREKDADGIYRNCNQAMVDTLGLDSKNDIIGKTDHELPWSNQADILIENDKFVMRSRKVQRSKEEPVTTNDGKLLIFIVAKAPLYDQAGKVIGTVGNSIDITRQKELEKSIRVMKEKAETASQAKSKFIANISHDIRTPITGIMGILQDLLHTAQESKLAFKNPRNDECAISRVS